MRIELTPSQADLLIELAEDKRDHLQGQLANNFGPRSKDPAYFRRDIALLEAAIVNLRRIV